MQFSSHGRKRVALLDDVVRAVMRRVEGIRRLLNSQPTEESLRQYHQDSLTLSVSFERLRSVFYPTTYQRTLILVVSLCQEVEHIINLRNVAGRNSNDSRNNENNNSTHNTTNVLPNPVTDNISITSTTTRDISPIREENERQNLDDAPSVAQADKTPRFKIDRKKLEQLLSVGFSVKKIAQDDLLWRKLHHNTVHNFMARNHMQPVRQKFSTLSDDQLKLEITKINLNFLNSGYREVWSHLKNQNPPIIVQRERCRRLFADVDPVDTAQHWVQVTNKQQCSVPIPNTMWHIDSNHKLIW